jgi:hypothetical protein
MVNANSQVLKLKNIKKTDQLYVLLLPLLFFIPFFSAGVIPIHDGLYKFQAFDFFYTNILLYNELPLWLSNGSFGNTVTPIQIAAITPCGYLAIALGKILNIQSSLLLYKTSFYLEYHFFAYGVFLLSKEILICKISRIYLVAACLLTTNWLVQPWFNFHIHYLLPYSFYFLIRNQKTRNANFLVLTVFVELISMIGNAGYFPVLHAFILTLFVLLINTKNNIALTIENMKLASKLGATSLLIFLTTLLGSVLYVFSTQKIITPNLSASEVGFAIDNFLNYARLTPTTTLMGYATGGAYNKDNTYYIGLGPLLLVTYGIFKSRSRYFHSFTVVFVALLLLSLGGLAARCFYHFPGMFLYRHIGLVFSIGALVLLISSALIVDGGLVAQKRRGVRLGKVQDDYQSPYLIFILLVILFIDLLISWRPGDNQTLFEIDKDTSLLFFLKLSIYLLYLVWVLQKKPRKFWMIVGFVGLTVCDLLSAYGLSLKRGPFFEHVDESVFSVQNILMPANRTNSINLTQEAQVANQRVEVLKFLKRNFQSHNELYALSYAWSGIDSCNIGAAFRNDLWNPYIVKAFEARNNAQAVGALSNLVLNTDSEFLSAIGCGSEKFRLTRNYVLAKEGHEAALLKNIDAGKDQVLLNELQPTFKSVPNKSAEKANVEIENFSANFVQVSSNVPGSTPALLFYSDGWSKFWEVKIDGQVGVLARANIGFKAVEIPPGKHVVTFRFGDRSPEKYIAHFLFFVGLMVSLIVWVISIFHLTGVVELNRSLPFT